MQAAASRIPAAWKSTASSTSAAAEPGRSRRAAGRTRPDTTFTSATRAARRDATYCRAHHGSMWAARGTSGKAGGGGVARGGGTHAIAGGLYVAAQPGASGAYAMSGGALTTPSVENNGTFDQTGGTASVGAMSGVGNTSVGAGASLSADAIRQTSLTLGGVVTINANGGASAGPSVVRTLSIAGGVDN